MAGRALNEELQLCAGHHHTGRPPLIWKDVPEEETLTCHLKDGGMLSSGGKGSEMPPGRATGTVGTWAWELQRQEGRARGWRASEAPFRN